MEPHALSTCCAAHDLRDGRASVSSRDDLTGSRVDALAVDQASRRVGPLRAAEEQDVRLRAATAHTIEKGSARRTRQPWLAWSTVERERMVHGASHGASYGSWQNSAPRLTRAAVGSPVDGVVHPAAALLHAKAAPLALGQESLGRVLRDVLWENDVPATRMLDRHRSARVRTVRRLAKGGFQWAQRRFTGTRSRRRSTSRSTRCPGTTC